MAGAWHSIDALEGIFICIHTWLCFNIDRSIPSIVMPKYWLTSKPAPNPPVLWIGWSGRARISSVTSPNQTRLLPLLASTKWVIFRQSSAPLSSPMPSIMANILPSLATVATSTLSHHLFTQTQVISVLLWSLWPIKYPLWVMSRRTPLIKVHCWYLLGRCQGEAQHGPITNVCPSFLWTEDHWKLRAQRWFWGQNGRNLPSPPLMGSTHARTIDPRREWHLQYWRSCWSFH